MPYLGPETQGLGESLQRFGQELRRCRMQAGMSQTMLADEAGVAQSTISRLERGRAPQAAMVKLVLLGEVLGNRLPLGYCPHAHGCAWERLDTLGRPVRSPALQRDWWLATGLPLSEDDEPSALVAMPEDDEPDSPIRPAYSRWPTEICPDPTGGTGHHPRLAKRNGLPVRRPYAMVVRRASFWNWAGTHHFRK